MSKKRIIGIDFGNTIVHRNYDVFVANRYALEVIKRMVGDMWTTNVYIISKVNGRQEEEVTRWLSKNRFYDRTGLDVTNVRFCKERKDKAEICRALGITHHIDDRPEVMAHLSQKIKKYLYSPVPLDVTRYFNSLHNTRIVNNWVDVKHEFFGD